MPAQSIFLSMSAIQQHQACFLMLSFLDSIFFDSNFHTHFLLSLCLIDLILTFEILIKSIITNSYSALCHALLEKSLICLSFSLHFVFLFDFSANLSVTSYNSISFS